MHTHGLFVKEPCHLITSTCYNVTMMFYSTQQGLNTIPSSCIFKGMYCSGICKYILVLCIARRYITLKSNFAYHRLHCWISFVYQVFHFSSTTIWIVLQRMLMASCMFGEKSLIPLSSLFIIVFFW